MSDTTIQSLISSKLLRLMNISEITGYGAIAFDWSPIKGAPECFDVSISTTKVSNNSLELVGNFAFQIKLPENSLSITDKGASEAIGLIKKTSLFYDNTKSAIFERNLADRLMACIYKLLEEGENRIILQGPMFPKLMGRIGYRYFEEEVTIGAVTFWPLWFPVSSNNLISEGAFKLGTGDVLRISETRSTSGLTEAWKTWSIFSEKAEKKEVYYILDIFCQFPYDDGQTLVWEKKIRSIENVFSLPGLVIFQGHMIWLPFGLGLAWETCRKDRDLSSVHVGALQKLLRPFEKDVPEMYRSGWEPIEVTFLRTLVGKSLVNIQLENAIANKIVESVPKHRDEILKATRDGAHDHMCRIWKDELGGVNCWKRLLEIF